MPRIQKLKQVLAESFVPDKADPGTVFIAKDTQRVWLAVRSGEVLCLTDILDGTTATVRAPGPQGKQGEQGKPGPQGEQGKIGPAGRDGVDGRSIVGQAGPAGSNGHDGVDGKDGQSIVGPKGEQGPPGSVTFVGPAEVEEAVQKVRAELIAQRARFIAAVRVALEKNTTRECHPTIHRTVDAVLRKLKIDSRI
jgi:hypothetical protein